MQHRMTLLFFVFLVVGAGITIGFITAPGLWYAELRNLAGLVLEKAAIGPTKTMNGLQGFETSRSLNVPVTRFHSRHDYDLVLKQRLYGSRSELLHLAQN